MRKTQGFYRALCSLAVVFFTALSLAGCQTGQLDVAATYSAEAGFCYPPVTWGMSIEETEKAIGQKFGDAYAGSEEEGVDYRGSTPYDHALFQTSPPETVTWEGMTGDVSYQFKNGELWAVSLLFDLFESPKAETELDGLVPALDKAYGKDAVTTSEAETDIHDASTAWQRQWSASHENGSRTTATLSAVITDGEIGSVSLSFSRFPGGA